MASLSVAPLIVPAVTSHTATVIFLHGLGDTGAGWLDIAQNWRARGKFDQVKFMFPNAPKIPITVNFGMRMPGWYDITTFDDLQDKSNDETGILRSRDYITSLIKQEVEESRIPSERIVLGGFSQGGAMSLFTGLTGEYSLGGIVGLSSYLLMYTKIKDMLSAANKATPVFMGHGDSDPLVKYDWGEKTAEAIRQMGWKVDFKTYKGLVHSATPGEIDDVGSFIDNVLTPTHQEL